MSAFERKLKEMEAARLREALVKSGLRTREDDLWVKMGQSLSFDIVVYRGVYPLAIFEIREQLPGRELLPEAQNKLKEAISFTNARYGVLTNTERHLLYDKSSPEDGFREVSFEEVVNALLNDPEIAFTGDLREQIARIIQDNASKYLPGNSELIEFLANGTLSKKVNFSNSSNTFSFVGDKRGIQSFENQFFIKLIGEFKEKSICRYTSLNTLYFMLNNLTFRMNGIAGMNDKSEVNYVDTYLLGVEKPLYKEHYNTIIAMNKRYISSCTSINRKDDLTLWRLYSEDGKGVCLVFNVRTKYLKNKILLNRVKYADKNGRNAELDYLKAIKDEVEALTGFNFEFRKLGYWKHFFKPYDYSIEEEIRLLVIDDDTLTKVNSDWVITREHRILIPFIDVALNDAAFPIRLSEIILGPKCPEKEVNLVQIEELIRRKKREIKEEDKESSLAGLQVRLSDIEHYR